MEAEEKKVDKKKDSILKDVLDMLLYFGTVMLVVLIIYNFVGQQVEVNGSSMENTLKNEDRLILEKISYRFNDPERFDIVVFRPYEEYKDEYYIKRIIGLPGETIQIIGNKIYIDGEVLEEDYGNEPMRDPGMAEEPIVMGEDEYFVLGDNRNHSTDSRYEVGKVKREAIIGRTFARIWPLSEMEILKHQ
ncbi:signal peptidase I [Mobilisporobacter senegalensis]|uniref:Signal peptidase I n=1 Tax=Mobilisporobacter senegalensis TaxID=1329262 RepID=A0A3N1XZM6_9FIRM|nr:signal peptidase I [Mobilisporobacter senegalensis]ROR30712.1 signal peptidase I [Mobilisporobacter senegalensis]